ncbi:MAG: hypothetical protein BZY88_19545 [SAR202 cluster bacterium Io17-Chloro-G9]|nr:MAG: hypothetical protein BZY88_19545 [SAR202 cluster bacterium Io17-Chloro-G9]
MKLENRCQVPADLDSTWKLVTDVPRAAACVPGIKDVSADGENRYRASLQARVGPMGFTMSGTILVLEQDRDKAEARFQVDASDRRLGGSIRAEMTVRLTAQPQGHTEMFITTDTTFMGKLGEMGQSVIQRKARSTLEEFSRNLAKLFDAPTA